MNHSISNQELLQQICDFARGHGRGLYANFTPEILRDYFVFHAGQRTLSFVREDNAITGVGVAWQMRTAEILLRHKLARAMFDWQATEEGADGLWIADVVALHAGARRGLLAGMIKRFPQYPNLQIYTRRKHARRLWRIQPLALARLIYGHEPTGIRQQLEGQAS